MLTDIVTREIAAGIFFYVIQYMIQLLTGAVRSGFFNRLRMGQSDFQGVHQQSSGAICCHNLRSSRIGQSFLISGVGLFNKFLQRFFTAAPEVHPGGNPVAALRVKTENFAAVRFFAGGLADGFIAGNVPEKSSPPVRTHSAVVIKKYYAAGEQFHDLDIFGYGVTVDEMCGLGWGGVDFFSNLVGEDMAVQLNNANFYLTLPLKEQAMGLKLAIKDVEAFTALLNGAGDPYVSVGGTSKRGLDSLTDEALTNA